jgi:sugar phosphate isomerase/epimerase
VSTRVYEGQRLNREHLLEIAAFGFDTVEVHAAPTHVDASNEAVVADLQQWLAEAQLDLHAVRVPAGTPDEHVDAALFVARRIPFPVVTLQIVRPREAAKTIERLTASAEPLGVVVAIDSNSEGLSPAASLAHFVEGFDARVGVSLDFARAQRDGDLVDAIETVAEHLVSAHVPIDNRIDWASALTTVQKVGYEGALIFDLPPRRSAKELLQQARTARERMARLL